MWLSERSLEFGRRATAIATVVVAGIGLAGCLQPLYGGVPGSNLRADLQAIKIEPISERLGHYLENELIFGLNGTGSTVTPKYKLTIKLRETVETPLVDTTTGRATAATVVVDADYILTPIAGGDTITSGVAFTAASYDRTTQRFADIRAARDAEIRDAKTLSDQIVTRLAAALRARAPQS